MRVFVFNNSIVLSISSYFYLPVVIIFLLFKRNMPINFFKEILLLYRILFLLIYIVSFELNLTKFFYHNKSLLIRVHRIVFFSGGGALPD